MVNNKVNSTSFKKGHTRTRGNKNPMWKGDEAGYTSIHDWLYLRLGKPRTDIERKKRHKRLYGKNAKLPVRGTGLRKLRNV